MKIMQIVIIACNEKVHDLITEAALQVRLSDRGGGCPVWILSMRVLFGEFPSLNVGR